MQLLHSYFLVESESVGQLELRLRLLSGLFLMLTLLLKVYIAVFDELFPEFPHALWVFWFGVVAHNAGSSSGFVDLLLRDDLRLWVNLGRVEVRCLVRVAEDPTLGNGEGTFLCLEVLEGIYFDR
jgi:hypothetical protein